MVMVPPKDARRDLIALVLAVGLTVSLLMVTAGVLVAGAHRGDYTISDNAVQLLTGWGGGIVGILGAVFGYEAGARANRGAESEDQDLNPPTDRP